MINYLSYIHDNNLENTAGNHKKINKFSIVIPCLHRLSFLCHFNINSDFKLIIANQVPLFCSVFSYICLNFKIIFISFDLDIILKGVCKCLKISIYSHDMSFTAYFKLDFLTDRMPHHVDICSIGSL